MFGILIFLFLQDQLCRPLIATYMTDIVNPSDEYLKASVLEISDEKTTTVLNQIDTLSFFTDDDDDDADNTNNNDNVEESMENDDLIGLDDIIIDDKDKPSIHVPEVIEILDKTENETQNSYKNETVGEEFPLRDTIRNIEDAGNNDNATSQIRVLHPLAGLMLQPESEKSISDISTINFTTDSACLSWTHHGDKTTNCVYLLDGTTPSSYVIKQVNDQVNFTIYHLPTPGKEYDFTISCENENGKEFVHFFTFKTKPSAIPRLSITSSNTSSVTVEWMQPGYLDDVEVFMDGREISTVLDKPGSGEGGGKVHLTIRELPHSGYIYHVTIYVISNLLKSDGYDLHIATAPDQPGEIEVNEEQESSVGLTWIQNGDFQEFLMKLNNTNKPVKFRFNENSSIVTCSIFGEFSSGSYHVITLVSISASGDESEPRIFHYVKDPMAPTQIKYINSNSTSVCFSWHQHGHFDAVEIIGHNDQGKMRFRDWNYKISSEGIIDGCLSGVHGTYHGFVVRVVRKHLKTSSPVFLFSAFKPPSNLRITNIETDYAELWLDMTPSTTLSSSTSFSSTSFPYQMLDFVLTSSVPGFERSQYVALTSFTVRAELNGLSPGIFYQVKVSGISPFYDDLPRSLPLFFVTVAESPRFYLSDILETTVKMDRILPSDCGHIEITISKFVLANPVKGWPREDTFACNVSSFQLSDLEPNSKYKILSKTVSTLYNSNLFSQQHNESFQTRSAAISYQFWTKPQPIKDLKIMNVNSSSFTLDWSFQKTQTFDSLLEYQHFHQVQMTSNRQRDWREKYYSIQITVKNASGFEVQQTKLACLISSQDLQKIECPTSHSFIDLAPSTNYTVSVNIRNPGAHSKDMCLSVYTEPPVVFVVFGDTLVIGVLLAFLIVLFFVIIVILLRRVRHSKPQIMQPSSKRTSQVYGYQNPMFSVELIENMPKPENIKISEFEVYVKNLRRNSRRQLCFQFMLLNQQSVHHPSTAAQLTENRHKNRFSNILPYEHSRVKLSNYPGNSDYINANFIPGFQRKEEYIATQAPVKDSINDFWKMIYQQNVNTVVMLTNLVENGKERCKQYWPHNDAVTKFGDIQVCLKEELNLNHHTKRTLEIKMADGKWRPLHHFQFLSWSDEEGVEDVKVVVDFLKEVRQHLLDSQCDTNSPLVVHCSAGTGRSGTFILLDRFYQQVEGQDSDKEINLFDVALELRNARTHMIQTEIQYVFAHECLVQMISRKFSGNISASDSTSIARMSISPTPTDCS